MNKQEEVYITLQKTCNIKVGDIVKVVRVAKSQEMGWKYIWIDMDNAVGKLFKVLQKGSENKGYELELLIGVDGDLHAYYPFFVLEKVKKPKDSYRPWRMEEVPVMVLTRDKNNPRAVGIITASLYDSKVIISSIDVKIHPLMEHSIDGFNQGFSANTYLELREHSLDGGKTWHPCGIKLT